MLTGLTLGEAARMVGATLEGDADLIIHAAAPLAHAGSDDVSFFDGRQDPDLLLSTRAGAVIVPPTFVSPRPGLNLLRSPGPHQAFLTLGRELWLRHHAPVPAVSPGAVIDPLARIGPSVHIAHGCTVGPGAEIGRGAVLHPGVQISAGARVGAETILLNHVYVGPGVRIGERCIIHPGAVLGFSYRPYPPGSDAPDKGPSCGGVLIEDGVEIGPNTVVEAGERVPTRIEQGAKIGALVMVGHDCIIGPRAELVAMVGLAGGAQVGASALLLGQVGVSGTARIGERAVILGHSAVAGDVPARSEYGGYLARPRQEWLRAQAAVNALPRWLKRLRELERKVAQLLGTRESVNKE